MIAIKRLQSIFWILVVAIGALATYLIFLRVATERNAVRALEVEIAATKGQIRYLEAEFGARASLRQLERWNAESFRYSAPQASQFLPGEAALAQLDRIAPNGGDYAAPPVMVAMVQAPGDSPAAALARNPSPAATRVAETAMSAPAERPALASVAASASASGSTSAAAKRPAAASRAATPSAASRLAMLDQKLLDDAALRQLGDEADAGDDRSAR